MTCKWLTHHNRTELKQLNKEFIKASAMPSENLSKLDDNGYRMIAYVKADHLDISKGKHFGVILAEVQLDTGAEVDLVSEEFLLKKLGLNESMWKSIPEEDQGPIGGFYAEGYTPKYQVELHWSQRNGGEFDKAKFYVIKGCRKDLVFQQSRFLKESGLQPHVCVAAKGGSKGM